MMEPVIKVRNLYKIFRIGENRVYALNGVSFDVYPGEFIAIVGTSGSGKSTCLNMLAGLEKPTKGEILIAGKRVDRMDEDGLVRFRRMHVGFIFQSYNLLNSMNALENVAMPLMSAFRRKSGLQRRESTCGSSGSGTRKPICRTRCPADSSSALVLPGRL